MNMSIRSAVIAALAIGGATAAQAATVSAPLPSTGSSDLILFINDTTAGTTYARVLTNTVSSLFSYSSAPAGTQGAITTYTGDTSFNVPTGADTAEQTYVTNAETAGENLQWGIIAGAYTSPTSTPGNAVALATASNVVSGVLTPGSADASIYNVAVSTLANTMLSTGSGLGHDIGVLDSKTADAYNATTSGVFGTLASKSGASLTFYGAGVQMSGLALGSSSTLYAMTASPGNNVYGYSLGTVTLSADGSTLSFVANAGGGNPPPVPLPAAVWLLGSGLVGLAGIGRRRAIKTGA